MEKLTNARLRGGNDNLETMAWTLIETTNNLINGIQNTTVSGESNNNNDIGATANSIVLSISCTQKIRSHHYFCS